MEKILRLYKLVDGGINDTPFPNSDNPIEIGAFRYDAKRMGGAPTITASVNYPSCLDDVWTEDVYAEFNGEKYYLKQTPTSSYNNESTMYKHDLELVSERIILDNVYFFDTVVGDPQGEDKPVSNSTNMVFFGNIHEFVSRINSSLQYAKLQKVSTDGAVTGYKVVVDEEIETEEKLMSFEDKFFSNVLQEIYNTYEVPYYFEGKTIHIGWAKSDVVIPTLGYGVDDALLSITKNNTNNKIINRATGTGSSDNIPFYYPNNSPKGEIAATSSNEGLSVTVVDTELYSNAVELKGVITRSNIDYENLSVKHLNESIYSGETFSGNMGYGGIGKQFTVSFDTQDVGELLISFSSDVVKYTLDGVDITDADFSVRYSLSLYSAQKKKTVFTSGMLDAVEGVRVPITSAGTGYILNIQVNYAATGKYAGKGGNITYNASFDFGSESGWTYDGKAIELKDVGLKVEGNPVVGDTITQTLVKYIKTSQKLLPSVYRETDGAERFYNATNNTYEGVTFNNPYVEGHPKEHIITVEDIKPSIKEMVNSMGLRMDMFSEFAYDLDDNDELIENEEGSEREYVHSYFFGKLRKLDFNLFDHAIEQQPMTISFTSGDCGACNFEIGVTEEFPQKNPVQVNADGTLKRDEKGRVICGQFEDIAEDECQPQQQDTINNEVWIALKKEDSTYGILMPRDVHRPKACAEGKNDGDTFVILGINLPLSYILNAEKKLEEEIIRYMKENNDEKFTFSIGFSRIYFEDNSAVLNQLSENSKISITYDDKPYDLYVSSFSYNMSEGDVLPEIRVELDDTLKVSQNALQNAISQVKSDLGRALSNIDVVGAATPYFIRKDADDEAQGRINFAKGIKFGEGGKVDIFDNNSAKLTIEYLEVTKKASFTSLEIQEKTHVGGQMLITPAAINCGEVEEFEDFYRCYFQTKGADGDEIFNQFAVGDQAICQTYNAWGSKYYWRLVVGIGEDYIDLSKTECDEESGIPSEGDKIIQLGNQVDAERQNAIVVAAYGDGSPYIIQYKGINSFALGEDKVVTKLSATENILTGKVHMEMGSDGLDNLPEWIQVRDTANEALEKVDAIGESSFEELRGYVDAIAEDLQGQIDGAIDSYFYEYEPSLDNAPAVDWDTADEKESHLNDTFTNLTDGRSWRWSKDSSDNYSWVEITDTATSEALRLAGKAQETADGKMTVFMSKPTPPYKRGDLWAGGENAPLMRCVNSRESGAYAASDWALADNAQQYADAIKEEITNSVNNTVANLNQAIADVEAAAKDYTDEGKAALEESIRILEESKANIADTYDKSTIDGKITSAEQNAIREAEELATAAQELAEANLKAWADGEIDDAEARAIAEAQAKVDAAKTEYNEALEAMRLDLETQISNKSAELAASIEDAKEASKDYTDEAKAEINAQIAAVESSKANLDDVYSKSVVDGKLTEREQAAINAAKAYADAENLLLDEQIRGWADGEIKDSEARAIAEAQAKVDAAKAEMEKYADDAVENIKVGGDNMLRNSGFTGDYLSEQLADESVLEAATELYSSPFDHWTTTGATVQNSTESTSGKQVYLANGSLAQTLYYKVRSGAEYVLSFKAKGTGFQYSFGGRSAYVTLSSSFKEYAIVVSTVSTSSAFSLSSANCTICDLKLEKGNKATAWSPSPLDNASDRAYYQSMKYLSDAITKGSTDFYGGLIVSNTMLLGDAGDDVLTKNTAGINGDLSDAADDVAFWAGGTMTQASETIIKYLEDPNFQPTDAELATMAKAVITHGGRAILNDIILRGIVYATGGEFAGKVSIDAPNVNGRVLIDDDGLVYYGTRDDGSEFTRLSLGGTCEGASLVARTKGYDNPSFCVDAAILALANKDANETAILAQGDILCDGGTLYTDKISAHFSATDEIEMVGDLNLEGDLTLSGNVQGLRTKTTVISSTYSSSSRRELTDLESSILVNLTSGTCYLRFPDFPIDGQEYVIDTMGAGLNITSNRPIYSLYGGSSSGTSTFSGRGCIRYKYYAGAKLWTVAILASV